MPAVRVLTPAGEGDQPVAAVRALLADGPPRPVAVELRQADVLPGLADKYRAVVSELETVLSPAGMATDEDIARARTHIRDYLGGGIVVTETDKEIRFETEANTEEMSLRLSGSGSQVFMVAGARCRRYLALVTALDIAARPRIFMCTPSATGP